MKRRRVTWGLYLACAAMHAVVTLGIWTIVLILDIKDVLNLMEYVSAVLVVPLIGTPFFGYAWAAWYIDRYNRRIPKHFCPCGYDLTGNVSGICPECGKTISDEATEPRSDARAAGANQRGP